jgi:protein subunit release factor B
MSEAPISESKQKALIEKMMTLGIRESDLEIKFVKGSGSGGQKINKSNTAVQITHLPTGIVCKSQKSRSQGNNKFFAKRLLTEKLEELKRKESGEKTSSQTEAGKIRKQKARRKRRQNSKK